MILELSLDTVEEGGVGGVVWGGVDRVCGAGMREGKSEGVKEGREGVQR